MKPMNRKIWRQAFAALLFAGMGSFCSADEKPLCGWEEPGNAEGWTPPGEKYAADYPLLSSPEQSQDKASIGKGSLKIAFDSTVEAAQSKRQGRVEKYYGGKADWSGFKALSGEIFVPEGAPPMKACLVVQSGADWKWQPGDYVDCVPGKWTPVRIDLEKLKGLDQIQKIYVVVFCPSGAFKGDLFLDNVKLDGGETTAAPQETKDGKKAVKAEPSKSAASCKPGVEPGSSPDAWLEDFESVSGWEKQGGAQVEAADSAAVGKSAVKFSMPGQAFKKVKGVKPRALDRLDDGYEGVSFWVKGDGSDMYGTIVLCGVHPLWMPYRYSCSFPLKDTGWKKYVVPWEDFSCEDAVYPMGSLGGMPPSGVQNIKVGSKWTICHNNKPIPKHSYCLDQLQLEEKAPSGKETPKLRPFEEVAKLLKERKPVSIVCLGDSITAGTSLKNPDAERYAQVLERILRQRFGYDSISVRSKGVGGAQGNDLRLWTDRDFADETPDLITIMYGYNDKTFAVPKEFYSYCLNDLIDRLARKTQGKAAVMLMPLLPGRNERFLMMDDYADCIRAAAKERGLRTCDLNKLFKAFGREGIAEHMADTAHPNAKGHEIIANAIADTLFDK